MESLVKWVKGNFLAGRVFADDVDLAHQNADWLAASNARPSSATGEPPIDRLAHEALKGGPLPREAHDYALLDSGHVTGESVVSLCGNVYSVPLGHVGATVTVRLHADRVRIWRDTMCLADHARAPDGAHKRVIAPAHFAELFGRKGRAQVMLYRTALLELDAGAAVYVGEVCRRRREKLREEILALYGLFEVHGAARLIAAMSQAQQVGAYGAEYIRALVEGGPPADIIPERLTLIVPGVPRQEEIDRLLSSYEAYVEGSAVAVGGQA
ncbi:MAG: Mu transposase domain-containing protein [Solirubrobacteraceae bacterium]